MNHPARGASIITRFGEPGLVSGPGHQLVLREIGVAWFTARKLSRLQNVDIAEADARFDAFVSLRAYFYRGPRPNSPRGAVTGRLDDLVHHGAPRLVQPSRAQDARRPARRHSFAAITNRRTKANSPESPVEAERARMAANAAAAVPHGGDGNDDEDDDDSDGGEEEAHRCGGPLSSRPLSPRPCNAAAPKGPAF